MQHLLVKEKLDFRYFRITSFYSYGTRTSQLDSLPPQSSEPHISSICIWLLLQSSWLQTGDCYCGRSSQTLKSWIPTISVATGRNRKKTSWINPFKSLPVQSTTPQPPLQELCKTTSCSANSTRVCGNIPELNYPQHQKFFPNLLPMLLLLELKPITHPTLCHSSLHQPCTYLATCSVSAQSPLQTTHFSLPSFLHLQPLFMHLLGLFPAKPYVSWGVEIVLEPRPLPSGMEGLSHVFCSVCPSEQVSQENCWILAALGFSCTPKHHSPGFFSTWQKPGQLLLILRLRNWF